MSIGAVIIGQGGKGSSSGGGGGTVTQGPAGLITAPWFVELSNGTVQVGTVSAPLRIDPTGTTVQPVDGALTHNNAAPTSNNIGALVALANAAAPTYTEGDQVLLSTDLSGVIRANTAEWGGVAVSAANTGAAGTETAQVVRPIARRSGSILTTTPLAGNATYTSTWFDTTVTGDSVVCAKALSNVGSAGGGFSIQCSDDTSNSSFTYTLTSNGNTINAVLTLLATIPSRYWRVNYVNGSSAQGSFEVTVCSWGGGSVNYGTALGAATGVTITCQPVTTLINTAADGSTPFSMGTMGNNAAQPLQTLGGYVTSNPASGSNYSAARTPSIFTGAQGGSAAGAFAVWTPQYTKKARLMKYKIEVAEDAAMTSGGPVNLSLRYGILAGTSLAGSFIETRGIGILPYQHRIYVPTNALATSGTLWDSDWMDFGNGIISPSAGQPLYCGLQTPAATTGVTPTWTLATTGQWEAGCVAFTTTSGRGNFKLIQSYSCVPGVGTSVSAATANTRGNTIIVVVRTTNIAAGVPTVAVTDTAGNTYTGLTAINNTSDVGPTNGSSLQLFYCLNATGTQANLAVNAITVTTSTHIATATSGIVLEYNNCPAIDASAQTTGTGNSTAPVAASYSPTSTGDLIISYAATGTNQASSASLGSPFFMIQQLGATNAAALMVGDNWGNGVLSAGLVNVIAIGTEE